MFKIIIFVTVFFVSSISNLYSNQSIKIKSGDVKSDNKSIVKSDTESFYDEDYFVGLKAYEDGLTDVTKIAFEVFLSKNRQGDEADFARYILYQIYQAEGNIESAKDTLLKIQDSKNYRFNTEKLMSDKMSLLLKTDCELAKKFLIDDMNAGLLLYTKSECVVDKPLTEAVAQRSYDPRELLFFINKIKDTQEHVLIVYDNLSDTEKSEEVLNYYSKYFYINKMKDAFFKLYNEYKTAESLELALNMSWDAGNYKEYITVFDRDIKVDFKLSKATYCRMIEASSRISAKYECDLIEKCLTKKNDTLVKTVIACLIKNGDKDKFAIFIDKLDSKNMREVCKYTGNFIEKDLFTTSSAKRFNTCEDKLSIYKHFVDKKDYNLIMSLAGKGIDQMDFAFMAYVYAQQNNMAEYENYLKRVEDINLKGYIERLTAK